MKDQKDKQTGDLLASPDAVRQARYAERMKAKGMRQRKFWLGELPTGPVIYLPAEDPPTAIHHRLHALGAHLSAEERQAVADGLLIQPLIGSLPNIMAPEWFDGLKRAAEGRRLMVLDTLRRFHIEEENASGPMGIPFRPEHPYDTHARLLLL